MASTLSPVTDGQCSSIQRRLADAFYERLYDPVRQLRAKGLSFNSIAHELNARGERSRYGLPFTPELVRRVLARAERLRCEATAQAETTRPAAAVGTALSSPLTSVEC